MKRVLIFDDNDLIVDLLKLAIKKLDDYEIIDHYSHPSQCSIFNGCFKCNGCKNGACCCDIIITDINMGGGLDGIDFLNDLYDKGVLNKKVLIISGSGYSKADLINKVKFNNFEYLPKPFSIKDLYRVFEKWSEMDLNGENGG
jgi:two-component SAPR family response regulator